nr:hypothetical protein Iba_chr05bCG5150 [Ipomoea batatas]
MVIFLCVCSSAVEEAMEMASKRARKTVVLRSSERNGSVNLSVDFFFLTRVFSAFFSFTFWKTCDMMFLRRHFLFPGLNSRIETQNEEIVFFFIEPNSFSERHGCSDSPVLGFPCLLVLLLLPEFCHYWPDDDQNLQRILDGGGSRPWHPGRGVDRNDGLGDSCGIESTLGCRRSTCRKLPSSYNKRERKN